jgi:hypothetical protein
MAALPAGAREEAQDCETVDVDGLAPALDGDDDRVCLEWQFELDSALETIESTMPIKRRRATDPPDSPPFPRPEHKLTITPEILDALALRVCDRMMTDRRFMPEPGAAAEFEPRSSSRAAISIRFRWPLFRLPFARSRRRRTVVGIFGPSY